MKVCSSRVNYVPVYRRRVLCRNQRKYSTKTLMQKVSGIIWILMCLERSERGVGKTKQFCAGESLLDHYKNFGS